MSAGGPGGRGEALHESDVRGAVTPPVAGAIGMAVRRVGLPPSRRLLQGARSGLGAGVVDEARHDQRPPGGMGCQDAVISQQVAAGAGTSTANFSSSSSGSSNKCVAPSARGWASSYSSWPVELSDNRSRASGGRKR
jgi:hypothetical protein